MVRYSRLPRSSIFRPLDKLVDWSFRRIPPVHGLQANDAFCDVAFALGKARIRHRIKCAAVGTKEGPALGNWPCERHGSASVDTGATMRLERDKFQRAQPEWSAREILGARAPVPTRRTLGFR